jgi:predicted transport protein
MAISVSLNGENFEQVIYNKEDAFEQLIVQNALTIFGDKAIYIDTKKKVNTASLGGTIPDGFLIDLSDLEDPQFYLVEVEIQSHDFFKHIFPQITKFFAFYRDSKQRSKLIETMFSLFNDPVLARELKGLIGTKETYKFLKDAIDNGQNILIVIDGSKAEFEEIMDTYTDTWGRMVKVLIVNHFQRNNSNILTVEPPFQSITFEDAVSPSPDKEPSEPSKYTEEIFLQDRPAKIVKIYEKLKQTFINANSALRFSATKNYVGVVDKKRIAYIQLKRNRIHLILLMKEGDVKKSISMGHHKVVSFSEARQRMWGGNEPNCAIDIYDIDHWDEMQTLVKQLVEKYQEKE